MKKSIFLLGIVALLFSCNSPATKEAQEGAKTEDKAEVVFIDLTKLQDEAAKYVGKEVKTSGLVDHICKHGGKKMLLVADGADVHVMAEERLDDALMGKELSVIGIVKEDRTDEASLLKLEEDAINEHGEGEEAELRQERIVKYINMMRDSLKTVGVDHFSEYYLEYVSHEEKK